MFLFKQHFKLIFFYHHITKMRCVQSNIQNIDKDVSFTKNIRTYRHVQNS